MARSKPGRETRRGSGGDRGSPSELEDPAVQELLAVFRRIRDPEIRELAITMTREVADAAEKLGFDRPAPN